MFQIFVTPSLTLMTCKVRSILRKMEITASHMFDFQSHGLQKGSKGHFSLLETIVTPMLGLFPVCDANVSTQKRRKSSGLCWPLQAQAHGGACGPEGVRSGYFGKARTMRLRKPEHEAKWTLHGLVEGSSQATKCSTGPQATFMGIHGKPWGLSGIPPGTGVLAGLPCLPGLQWTEQDDFKARMLNRCCGEQDPEVQGMPEPEREGERDVLRFSTASLR